MRGLPQPWDRWDLGGPGWEPAVGVRKPLPRPGGKVSNTSEFLRGEDILGPVRRLGGHCTEVPTVVGTGGTTGVGCGGSSCAHAGRGACCSCGAACPTADEIGMVGFCGGTEADVEGQWAWITLGWSTCAWGCFGGAEALCLCG